MKVPIPNILFTLWYGLEAAIGKTGEAIAVAIVSLVMSGLWELLKPVISQLGSNILRRYRQWRLQRLYLKKTRQKRL